MKRLRTILISLLTLVGWISQSYATHIVGGELNYEWLSGDQYKITLKLYKDCGISIVPFDDPAGIYVYNGNNEIIDTLQLPVIQRDTLEATFEDTCLVVPPEICVDFARYEGIYTLPSTPNGYTLAYIRCCRNATIINAEGEDESGNPITPDLIGTTYTAVIPGSNLSTINSNPEFKEFPPIIICSGQTISVDQSAIDKDGDQLVYSICTPNVGGSLQQVFGNPLIENPPFQSINWIEPFDENNVIGGEIPLTINASTGLLSGVAPNMVGQFVVAVCVQEFRNGVLLSENKRDFQFNITDCAKVFNGDYELVDEPITDTLEIEINDTLFNYVLVCDTNLAIQFESLVEGTETVVWDFGDGSLISVEENPLHVFPDTGLYMVAIVADPGNQCADTFKQFISLQYQEVFANFDFENPQCYDITEGLQFTDLTVVEEQVEFWEWTFGDGQTSSIKNPTHFYDNDGSYEVTLAVQAFNGCRSTFEATVDVEKLDEFTLEDSIAICLSDTAILELEIEGEHTFLWSPAATLSNAFVQNPKAFPTENTTYSVQIFTTRAASGATCVQTDEITVLTNFSIPEIEIVTDEMQCDSIIELEIETTSTDNIIWAVNSDFNPIISNEMILETVQTNETQSYFVKATNQFCEAVDSIEIKQNGVFVSIDNVSICKGDELFIEASVESNSNALSFSWMFDGNTINNDVPNLNFVPLESTEIVLESQNSSGCIALDTMFVEVLNLPLIEASASQTTVINEQEIQLLANENENYQYSWTPINLLNNSMIYNPLATVVETSAFIVEVEDENGCFNTDTIKVNVVDQLCDEPNIFIPTAFSPNNDQLNDVFRIQGIVIQSMFLSIYDRWGNVVFETDDLSNTWDGRHNGILLGNGILGYSIAIECFGGEQFVKSGSLTLIQ